MTTRDEYTKKLKDQLDRWNADVARWEARAKAAQAEGKKQLEEQLKRVREQREKAMYNLKLLEGASQAAWADVARGADEAWDRMRTAIEKARTHFERK